MGRSVADLVRRLDELEAKQSVRATLYRYAHAIDQGDAAAFADCFTDDAVYDVRLNPQTGVATASFRHEGRAEILAFAENHTHVPDSWHRHVVSEPVTEVDSDRAATASSCFVRVDAHPQEPYIRAFGRYLDRLVRCPDGRWRLRVRIAEVDALQALAADALRRTP